VRKENLLELPEVLLSGEAAVGDEEVLDGEDSREIDVVMERR
jgi:hypothetical protein